MTKLTREQKAELKLWSLRIYPLYYSRDNYRNATWWVGLCRGEEFISGWGIGSLEDAIKTALHIEFRRRWSPFPDLRPIPPRQVYMQISAKWALKNQQKVLELLK